MMMGGFWCVFWYSLSALQGGGSSASGCQLWQCLLHSTVCSSGNAHAHGARSRLHGPCRQPGSLLAVHQRSMCLHAATGPKQPAGGPTACAARLMQRRVRGRWPAALASAAWPRPLLPCTPGPRRCLPPPCAHSCCQARGGRATACARPVSRASRPGGRRPAWDAAAWRALGA